MYNFILRWTSTSIHPLGELRVKLTHYNNYSLNAIHHIVAEDARPAIEPSSIRNGAVLLLASYLIASILPIQQHVYIYIRTQPFDHCRRLQNDIQRNSFRQIERRREKAFPADWRKPFVWGRLLCPEQSMTDLYARQMHIPFINRSLFRRDLLWPWIINRAATPVRDEWAVCGQF